MASALAVTIDSSKGKTLSGPYNNTPIHQLGNTLKKAVKDLSDITYQSVGKI